MSDVEIKKPPSFKGGVRLLRLGEMEGGGTGPR